MRGGNDAVEKLQLPPLSTLSAVQLFKSNSFPHIVSVIYRMCDLALPPSLFLWSRVALIAPLILSDLSLY